MNLPSLREHTSGVLAALDDELPGRFGDAEAPTGAGWQGGPPGVSDFFGYGIVYALDVSLDGPIDESSNDDGDFYVQVTAVGATRAQAELVADIAKGRLLSKAITIAGRAVNTVHLTDNAGGTRRDDTVQPGLFIATPRFRINTTPT